MPQTHSKSQDLIERVVKSSHDRHKKFVFSKPIKILAEGGILVKKLPEDHIVKNFLEDKNLDLSNNKPPERVYHSYDVKIEPNKSIEKSTPRVLIHQEEEREILDIHESNHELSLSNNNSKKELLAPEKVVKPLVSVVEDTEFESLDNAINKTKADIKATVNHDYQKPVFKKVEANALPEYKKQRVPVRPVQEDVKINNTQPSKKYEEFTSELDSFLSGEAKPQVDQVGGSSLAVRAEKTNNRTYSGATDSHKVQKGRVFVKIKELFWTIFLFILLITVLAGAFYYYKSLSSLEKGNTSYADAKVLGVSEISNVQTGGDFSPATLSKKNKDLTVKIDWLQTNFGNKVDTNGCLDNNICALDKDPDNDGLINIYEYNFGTNPNKNDTDGDGLADGDELFVYYTSSLAFNSDSEEDGDGYEISICKDPTKNINGKLLNSEKKLLESRTQKYKLHEPTISTLKAKGAVEKDISVGYVVLNCK